MRLIGRICGLKNHRAFQIIIDEEEDISQLKQIFEEETGIPTQYQILTTIVEGQYIKVIEGWTLEFYQFYNNQLINVHDFRKGEFHFNHPSTQKKVEETEYNREDSILYYKKLGLVVQKQEEADGYRDSQNQSDDNSDQFNQQNDRIENSLTSTKAHSIYSLSEHDEGYTPQKYNELLQQFILAIQHKKWRNAKSLLEQHQNFMKKDWKHTNNADIISELDENGWNSLHYATYQEYEDICKKLINEGGVDVNKPTTDDWTPLQLAVFKNNLKLVKILTDSDDLIIDQQTSRGSALHLASAKGYIKIVQYLVLDKNANPDLKHVVEGKSPFAVATKQVRFFFRQHQQIKKLDIQTAIDFLENRKVNFMKEFLEKVKTVVKLFFCENQNRGKQQFKQSLYYKLTVIYQMT